MWKYFSPNFFLRFQERSVVSVIILFPQAALPYLIKELLDYWHGAINSFETILANH